MESKGRLIETARSVFRKKTALTLEIDGLPDVSKFEGKTLNISVEIDRPRRSRNANAYFHVLSGKLADVRRVSKAKQKNELITTYGQILYIDGVPAMVKTNLAREAVENQESLHMKFIRYSAEESAAFYTIYRGSHTYDSREMSILIEGAVSEAKEEGIETMTPDEIARMTAAWKAQGGYF